MTRKGEAEPSLLMRLDKVAHQLDVSRSTVLNKIYEGQLVGVNVATKGTSQLRVTRASFEAYVAKLEAEAAARFRAGAA